MRRGLLFTVFINPWSGLVQSPWRYCRLHAIYEPTFFYVGKVEETVKYVAAPWREPFFKRDEDAPASRRMTVAQAAIG